MTTTSDLRAHLDAHGVDGAPSESGWYVVRAVTTVVIVATRASWGMVYAVGCEHSGRYLFASDIVRYAPLTLAPPAGRDLDPNSITVRRTPQPSSPPPPPHDDPIILRACSCGKCRTGHSHG